MDYRRDASGRSDADGASVNIRDEDDEYDTDMVDLLDVIGMFIAVYGDGSIADLRQIRRSRRFLLLRMYRTRCSCLILGASLIEDRRIISQGNRQWTNCASQGQLQHKRKWTRGRRSR